MATSHLHGHVPDKTEYGDPATRQQKLLLACSFLAHWKTCHFLRSSPKHCVPRISSASVVRTSMCLCRFYLPSFHEIKAGAFR